MAEKQRQRISAVFAQSFPVPAGALKGPEPGVRGDHARRHAQSTVLRGKSQPSLVFFCRRRLTRRIRHQIFNGSTRWLPHYHGILGWLAARGDCSDLNPFIKTWISMVDTQRALNLGGCVTPEVERWLESGALWMDDTDAIDPFFGCSVRLPKLMVSGVTVSGCWEGN